jgi:hypothetical protein
VLGAFLPCKIRKFRKFRSFRRFMACTTSRMPFESEKSFSHFFKWLFTKMAVSIRLNGGWVRIWIGAGGEPFHAEQCLDHFRTSFSWVGNNPSLQTSFVKIRESATRHANLLMDFSLLSWWDTIYMLQLVFIYHGMKLINFLCLSHLFSYQCLAGKAFPIGNTFSTKYLLNTGSVQKNCV